MLKSFFSIIDIKIFLFAFALGMFYVYILDDGKKVYVYPSPDNIGKIQYQDKAGSCFKFEQSKLSCPKDESKIRQIPVQN